MIVTCVAAVAAIATDWRRLLKDFNDFCYHARHLVAGKRDEAQHLTIVAVDGDTCGRLKQDPLALWQPHFAAVMQVLEGAKAKIGGLDFTYATSAGTWLTPL